MTTKAKAFNTKKANAGHDKQKARKVHKAKLKSGEKVELTFKKYR